jgi:hypothetical protein
MIALPCRCGAVHTVPFMCCPSCGAPVLSARPGTLPCVIELYAINGPFSTPVVIMRGDVPVDRVEQVELARGVLKITISMAAQSSACSVSAKKVYECLRDGDQALRL